ncbi:MAG: hypothetical protein U1F66_09840 [bacterium]
MDLSEKLAYLKTLVKLLEECADLISSRLGRPLYLVEEDKSRFRYANPDSRYFQALKAIRLVSLLNASIHLFKHGHFHEMLILLRSLYESDSQIEFVQEAHVFGVQTLDQPKIVEEFFKRDLQTAKDLLENPRKDTRVPKKKIRAAIARMSKSIANAERVRRIAEIMEDAYSAYVHGEYPTIMELYEGGAERFRLRGMFNTPKKEVYLWQMASAIMNAMNSFIVVLRNFDLTQRADYVLAMRKELEGSELYKYKDENREVKPR